ncbi:MAG TPA: O-antigen ligase family protein [Baekduia sp.]|uniref:O-antigen ligase family protein n=1 Tax=Baekduia sp. TaxID=2600305 RepID=UPI002D791D65|nr:O-antigen ligase family protein [Baekduia sp.]HET6509458.1 O-antigen ligase family protein [Baekduia sp.]
MSTVAAPPDARILSGDRARRRAPRRPGPELLFGAALTAALTAVALRGGGGLSLNSTTKVEMALDVVGGLLAVLAALAAGVRRLWGGITIALFAALAILTAVSITWAVQPSDALLEANRTFSYLMVFAGAAILARTVGAWWSGLLGAIVATTTLISLWAVLTKVFPGALASEETYARLREPFDYWNAVGLTAALGVPGALWLGARRTGHGAVNALAYPIVGVQILTVMLAYSRGSLLAVAVGCAFWFLVVPLRLRGVAVLAVGAVGALAVTGWVFAQDTLTKDGVPLDERATSGHELGVAVLAMILVLLAIGLAMVFAAARQAPSRGARRRAGAVILVGVALLPVAVVVALAMSTKGLGGSITDGWKSLTDPHDQTTVLNDPSRLTSVGSVRAKYWNESIKIFRAHPLKGVGAGGYETARLRYRTDNLAVRHAHGYVVQTAADMGLLGLLVSGLLLMAWIGATGRTLGWRVPWLSRPGPKVAYGPEHVAMATLATTVLVFGVHSFIDWTWFVPGTAVIALVAAGWVAARGPLHEPAAEPRLLRERIALGARRPERVAAAVAGLALGLLAAWVAWQPERSVDADNAALAVVDKDPAKALAYTKTAQDRNPLSIDPLLTRAVVENTAKHPDRAREALVEAVRLQPSNPQTWEYLSRFTAEQDRDPVLALRLLGPALYLDPKSPTGAQDYLEALRLATQQAQEKADRKAAAKAEAEKKHRKKKG